MPSITTIVEYFPVFCEDSRSGFKKEVFTTVDENEEEHPYYAGLKAELKSSIGIYIFYDSRGQALYVGQSTCNLWDEIKNAYNRDRDVQQICLVDHPLERRYEFNTERSSNRRIKNRIVPLHDLACYFSAYKVKESLINDLEAMLIRGFINSLLNKHVEMLGQ
jgi:hypothetical protein